jgi:diguanylate cyclase
MIDLSIHDFDSAGHAVLSFLHRRLGFDLWMVTRTEGDDWIVLQTEDHGYSVTPGTVFPWADSFCAEMVKGNGPCIAPNSDIVPAYGAAPIGRHVEIGAYIGMPLNRADGSLFGTLCAIDPQHQPANIANDQNLIELLAGLLSAVLQADLKASEATRRSEKLAVEAHTDPMTGLYNRRAWDQLLAKEEERCCRYGHPACVLVADLDELKQVNDQLGHGAGDTLIQHAAQALQKAARDVDVVARLGGDEFAVLAVECDAAGAAAILARTRSALQEFQVRASLGIASRGHTGGLRQACETADRLMYKEKRSR